MRQRAGGRGARPAGRTEPIVDRKLYDLRRVQDAVLAALYNPKLAAKAVAVLANLNSAESQRALVEVASRFTLPLELRQAAATAFRQNTQKYGILLTTDEIRRQYRRYNESENMDAATQHVLGLILDCLEVRAEEDAGTEIEIWRFAIDDARFDRGSLGEDAPQVGPRHRIPS